VSDASVSARGDVEIGVSCALELASRGPRRPPCAEVHQLRTDALTRPVPARRIRLADEYIAGGTSAPDSFESSGLDELGKVVGRLRATHAADLLICPASQLYFVPVLQNSQGPLLCGLEFFSSGSRHYSP
jgi:hypothetical protein